MAKIKNTTVKLLLDIVMALVLVLLYKKNVLTLTFHEVAGLIIGLAFLVHVLFNRKWVAGVTKKLFSPSTPGRTKFSYWMSVLLVVDFALIIVSGCFISKIVFGNGQQGHGQTQEVVATQTVDGAEQGELADGEQATGEQPTDGQADGAADAEAGDEQADDVSDDGAAGDAKAAGEQKGGHDGEQATDAQAGDAKAAGEQKGGHDGEQPTDEQADGAADDGAAVSTEVVAAQADDAADAGTAVAAAGDQDGASTDQDASNSKKKGGPWKTVHYFCSALALILVGIHLGLYWNTVKSFFRKYLNIPARTARNVCYVAMAVILVFGLYSIPTSNFSKWILMPFGINQQQGDHDKQSTATDTTVNGNATALSDEQSDQKTWSNETDQTADQSNAQSASDEKTWSHDGGDSSESASQDGTTDDERTWSRDEDESASDDQAEQATGEKTWSHDGGDSSESSAQTSDGTATTDQSSQATGQTSGKNYTVTITADTILQTIATYGSIIGVFTALTYWIDRALKRNKGAKRSKSADQA